MGAGIPGREVYKRKGPKTQKWSTQIHVRKLKGGPI